MVELYCSRIRSKLCYIEISLVTPSTVNLLQMKAAITAKKPFVIKKEIETRIRCVHITRDYQAQLQLLSITV